MIARDSMIHTTHLEFNPPRYYNLSMTCHAHGWKNLAPFDWDDSAQSLRFAAMLDDRPIDVTATQLDGVLDAEILSRSSLSDDNIRKFSAMIKRCLNLDFDTGVLLKAARSAGEEYVRLIEAGAGRLLKSPLLWEDAAKTLFTTNCSWTLTQKMCRSLCSEQFSETSPLGRYPFPAPETLLQYGPDQLRKMAPLGYRAEYLLAAAEIFAADPTLRAIESNTGGYAEAFSRVNALNGFGDYATRHLLLLAGYFDRVPIDSVVLSYLKRNYNCRKPESFIQRKYRKWGKYQWWGLKLEKMLNRQNWPGD